MGTWRYQRKHSCSFQVVAKYDVSKLFTILFPWQKFVKFQNTSTVCIGGGGLTVLNSVIFLKCIKKN